VAQGRRARSAILKAAISPPPAVVSGVLDALAPLGVTDLDRPLTSEQLGGGFAMRGPV
jgi:hypothetical protein